MANSRDRSGSDQAGSRPDGRSESARCRHAGGAAGTLVAAGRAAGHPFQKRAAACGCATLLALAAPVGSSDPLGPEIGTSHGYSAVGLPWTNPCGSARPSIGARAYLHRTYHLREMTVNDRDMGWSYAIRVSLPDEPGGPLDCVEVMDVQYFVLSSHLQYRPPQEISFAVTGSLYAALFNRSSHILSAEPVERDGVKAGEVVFYVPRVIREDLTIHHQAAALVYDVNGGVLACILTSNGVSLVAPSTTGGIDPR